MCNKHLTSKPFLSICITSYNRVDELYRCLKSVDSVYKDLIEIVVSEDCSPKKSEITQIVNLFISETDYSVIYNTNDNNLGFDRNFAKLLKLAKGEYLLFITDDDSFSGGALDKIIDKLQEIDCAVAFTPYFNYQKGSLDRKFNETIFIPQGIRSVNKYLYCSILLSGLIFKRNQIIDYNAENFKDLIYSQVYVFTSLLYKNNGCYIDVPLVQYIGDGENSFGLNDSSEKNALLSDRKSIYSNLEYHKGLIKIIEIFDNENRTDLMNSFAKEYSLKAYTGLHRARKVGRRELTAYWNKMNSLNIKLSIIAKIYYWALNVLGYKICDLIFHIPKKILFSLRKRSVS